MIEDNLSEEDIIRKYYYNWEKISQHHHLTEEFIRNHKDKVVWTDISFYQNLSENFIREFQDKVKWNIISHSQILSEEFIEEFKNEIDWETFTCNRFMTEDLARKYKDKINWANLYPYFKMSEEFIIEFQDKFGEYLWKEISSFQNLSLKFIKDNIEKLDIELLVKNKIISEEIKKGLRMYSDVL